MEEILQLLGREAHQVQIEVRLLELGEFLNEKFIVPVGDFAGLVVGDPVGFQLRRRQSRGDVDRHLVQSELERRLVACAADDDDALLVQHQRLPEAELA